jgi:hypothetical protein
MIFPVIILGLVFSLLIGAVVFLVRPSHSFRQLGLFLLVSIVGFFIGHFICEIFSLRLWMVGSVNLSGGLIGSLLGLGCLKIFGLREWK